jgi:hemoglobin
VIRSRAEIAPGTAAGVDEPMIRSLVHAFYARVRAEPTLGPIFDGAIGDGWDAHLAKLCDFWSSVVLMTGRFKGSPMAVHTALPDIGARHFALWLELFRTTARELCPPAAADLFIAKAEMIARSLQLGICAARGEFPFAPAVAAG